MAAYLAEPVARRAAVLAARTVATGSAGGFDGLTESLKRGCFESHPKGIASEGVPRRVVVVTAKGAPSARRSPFWRAQAAQQRSKLFNYPKITPVAGRRQSISGCAHYRAITALSRIRDKASGRIAPRTGSPLSERHPSLAGIERHRKPAQHPIG